MNEGVLFLSLGLHSLLLAGFGLWMWLVPAKPKKVEATRFPSLPVRVLSPEMLKELGLERSIVESETALTPQTPPRDQAAHLGERTQRVEKETRTANFGSVQGAVPQQAPRRPKDLDLSGRSLFIAPPGTTPAEDSVSPTGELSRGSMDALSDQVAIGPRTLLNTDEYVYASFFNRMKQEVGARWEPLVRSYLRNSPLSPGIYVTKVVFYLNPATEIVRIEIARSSGVGGLDGVARESLQQVQRMPNPPAALRQEDNLYRVELGFVVTFDKKGFQTEYVPDPRYMRPR